MGLDRFIHAQDEILGDVRREIVHGEKRTHWMWFVFPQVAGLGSSPAARHYAISGLAEAKRYLGHPQLGNRLAEMTQLMLGWAGRRSAFAILGQTDAVKFCSSMTLFEVAALKGDGGISQSADRFGHALDAFCQGRRDHRTLQLLNVSSAPARAA